MGKADVPLFKAQNAPKNACAETISAECEEHADFTKLLIEAETCRLSWFLKQAQVASEGASEGQRLYVKEVTADAR